MAVTDLIRIGLSLLGLGDDVKCHSMPNPPVFIAYRESLRRMARS